MKGFLSTHETNVQPFFNSPKNVKTWLKTALRSNNLIIYAVVLIVGYSMIVDTDVEHKACQILAQREQRQLITEDKGDGACDIGSPVEDAPNTPNDDSTRTLLTSYPGSGKCFTWAGKNYFVRLWQHEVWRRIRVCI